MQTATSLAKMGACVIITGRDKVKAVQVIAAINIESSDKGQPVVPVIFMSSYLSNLQALKTFSSELTHEVKQADILIKNTDIYSREFKNQTRA